MPTAILMIAHGSRVPAANADLRRLAEQVAAQRPADLIECAYLELAEPTIPAGLEACVQRGATRVLMLPYFLSAGAHVQRDLEEHRQVFSQKYPDLEFRCCPPLGPHPLLVEIVLDRLASVS